MRANGMPLISRYATPNSLTSRVSSSEKMLKLKNPSKILTRSFNGYYPTLMGVVFSGIVAVLEVCKLL